MAETDDGEREPGLLAIDEIYDALEADDPETALDLAAAALDATVEEDPVIRFLAGVALLDLERPAEAVEQLAIAVEADPEEPEFRCSLSRALFRCCRFAEAAEHARAALAADETQADAQYMQALIDERSGDEASAERRFARAAEIDPDRYPAPLRLSRTEFEHHVAAAMDRLPDAYRQHLERVAVTVEDLPSDEILLEEDPPFDPESLLGLFVGLSIADGGATGDLPPRILIFKGNLERLALERDELVEQIAITVYHELGHYLGLDEDELENIDLA